MPQYPHPYGYGQYHGQPPLQPYTYPNAPSYPVPGHVTPYNPSVTPVHRDVSQASYDMNATHIPGLGIGGTAPVESGVASWNQSAGFPVPTPHAPPQQVYGRNPFEADSSQPGASNGSRSDAPSNQAAIEAPRSSAIVEMEEGELSEGQFEDLYEPREDASDAPVKPVNKSFPLPVGESSQPASAADTPDGGFYGTDEDDGGKDARGNEGRERSASYSPFLSPREVQSEIPTPQTVMDKEAQSTRAEPVVEARSLASPNRQVSTQAPPAASTSNGPSNIGGSAVQSQGDPLSSFKSLQEAKKEAQKAILRLWPLGVKYQNYIEEGFDEKLIKGLFLDLHLDMPKAAAGSPAATSRATQVKQGGGTDQSKSSQPSKQPQAPPSTKDSASMSEQSRKGEERKDRIARLLAAKAAKTPAAPNPPKPAPTPSERTVPESQAQGPAPAAQTSAPSRSKTWGEKERLLQQKIAALQKAREARKAAEGTTGTGTAQGGSSEEIIMSQGISAGSSTSPSIPPAPKTFNGSQKSADAQAASSQATPSQLLSPLPGLALTPNGLQNTSNQRKRPVALDFVDYPSGQGVAKRPFVQARQETSLIIDVSDGSDDEDMEMDMDIGSPVEETLSSQSAGISGQHGPAIRDFPPLTDTFPKRQLSSPAPSVTPPGGRVTSTKRTTELDLKEKAIQDMRRKIALAEAKRKAKQSAGGSVTPNRSEQGIQRSKGTQPPPTQTTEFMSSQDGSDRSSSGFTPEPSSAYAPASSEAHLDPLQQGQRRGHMSSENPRVESSLTEKMKRLQQLQDEQERLKAELERSIAEQKRLAAELQQLDTTSPSTETAGPNGSKSETQPVQPVSTLEAPSEQQEEGCSTTQPGSATVDGQGRRSPPPQPVSGGGNDEAPSEVGSFHKRPEEGPSLGADKDIVGRVLDASADRSLEAPAESALFLPKGDAMVQEAAGDVLNPSPNPESAKNNSSAAHGLEQMGSSNADETTPMELESQSPSPEAVERTSSVNAESPTPLPDQISGSAQPRAPAQEIETEVAREVQVVSSSGAGTLGLTQQQVQDRPESKTHSKLKPYQSPLRYFHAYRFHPEYQNAVAGGLRSLTYSNRIDPERELCPFELTGEQCPTNCEYQHFRTISAPDDQILLELGNSDDLSDEQKSGFIKGLRELLQKFKADKVRDFDTIARGIVEFRTQFLGDKSKVLRLEGVTI
ncbi:hypothetical protein C7999DRAFT_16201 [Corynascus novoguineensis]|uniref:Putative zinc-finger domain-containing protein n=1 Tax=Corynascus novoguineensis TaxID=1126955 RepID=A0AAN7CPT7_9PEZI|nr:hypothetical protein C7999DRAFT_16201 [Corynascus novoguineensis]